MKNFWLFLPLLLGSSTVWAQITLSGLVTNEANKPVDGAIVVVKGTAVTATTLPNGQFLLRTTESLPLTLHIVANGYRERDVPVRGSNFRNIEVTMSDATLATNDEVKAVSRMLEPVQDVGVTVEKLGERQFASTPAVTTFDALQYVTGVDLMTQSLTFKSVNLRGFGSNNNTRLLQLTDGMDNRSPGLGFGFGAVAGLPDLDVENIELVAGPSSALYGPDALQGLMLTTSKDPFAYQGLSARVTLGVNNVGKTGFGPKPYADMAIRYALELSDRLAVKVNFQRLTGTDFIADDASDRSTQARAGFFATNSFRGGVAMGIAYRPNNDANTNLEYDGVNRYGDDINNGGAYRFPNNYANALLRGKLVTRTGYSELDLLGNRGRVFNNRANAALHYKLSDDVVATVSWQYGNGNLIRTAGFREYFPNYRRHQVKAELAGDNFFLRAYTTQQRAEGWSLGQMALAIDNTWKPLNQWAAEFGQVYIENKVGVTRARNEADRGRYAPGSAAFNAVRDTYASTFNTDTIPGYRGARGLRFRDNSQLWHYEGMYRFDQMFDAIDVVAGTSLRRYALESGGTLFMPQTTRGRRLEEYTINEFGTYVQATTNVSLGALTVRPSVAVRYDKNQYVAGGFTPRASAVLSLGGHHLRLSRQSGFRNPSPAQLFSVPVAGQPGEVGGRAYALAGLTTNPGYLQADVSAYQGGTATTPPTPVLLNSGRFTTEKIRSWEIGYRTQLGKKLDVDAFYFASRYDDLITTQTLVQLLNPAGGAQALLTPANYRTLLVNVNNPGNIFVRGWGLELAYRLGRGYTLSGNYAYQTGLITMRDASGRIRNDQAGIPIVKRKMSNPEVAQLGRNYFNSPEQRYVLTLANPRLTDRFGASMTYRWTGPMWYEQGITQGDVWLPAWSTLDAQVSYRVPNYKVLAKLGGTNLLNRYYAQGYGLAQVGGLYYVSLTFDELM